MTKNKYVKFLLGPGKVDGNNSTVGMRIVADYVDPENAQRTLLLERPVPATPAKPRGPRKQSVAPTTEAKPEIA